MEGKIRRLEQVEADLRQDLKHMYEDWTHSLSQLQTEREMRALLESRLASVIPDSPEIITAKRRRVQAV